MCGRFTLTVDPAQLKLLLDLGEVPAELPPRYNIAPTQPVAVVADASSRKVELFRWGLIPSWAKDPSIGSRLINARAETLEEKPAYRAAFKRRRCAVLSDGFFEWKKLEEGKRATKQPYYIQLAEGQPFAFAGLWEVWHSPEGDELQTCTIVTTEPNRLMAGIHDRMPVILDKESMWDWIDPDASPVGLHALLKPYPAKAMKAFPISKLVNRPENDRPEVIAPLDSK
jgi:putative SOS response-associated peptidase YedK